MKPKDLRDWIDSLTDDIEFEYSGIHGVVYPFHRDKISLYYDGKDVMAQSVEEAMRMPFIDGKSLNEVAELLDIG